MAKQQMGKKPQAKCVGKLEYFPFESFDELKKRINEGIVSIGVDGSVAFQWVQNGIYSTGRQKAVALFLAFLTFIVPIGFIIYILVTKTWFLLLALPILLIGFFIFNPGSAALLGSIRSGLILLTFGFLIWGVFFSIDWLIVLTLSLALFWFIQRILYRKATNWLLRAAIQHEDLFCLLWYANALNVRMYNGDSYWSTWKMEKGKSTHYDMSNTDDE